MLMRKMKIEYFKDTDTLYITLSNKHYAESLEIKEGIVIDLDNNDKVVGIEIEHASQIAETDKLEILSLPVHKGLC